MTTGLQGKRILVVEDEYFIASDIARTLTAAGAEVVGPVGDLESGLRLAGGPVDAAVLDVNLEETMSYPIADRLRERDVPYMLVTGYDGWSLPEIHRDAPRITKPFPPAAVLTLATSLLSRVGS